MAGEKKGTGWAPGLASRVACMGSSFLICEAGDAAQPCLGEGLETGRLPRDLCCLSVSRLRVPV